MKFKSSLRKIEELENTKKVKKELMKKQKEEETKD